MTNETVCGHPNCGTPLDEADDTSKLVERHDEWLATAMKSWMRKIQELPEDEDYVKNSVTWSLGVMAGIDRLATEIDRLNERLAFYIHDSAENKERAEHAETGLRKVRSYVWELYRTYGDYPESTRDVADRLKTMVYTPEELKAEAALPGTKEVKG